MAALLCFISINALLLLSKPGQTGSAPGLFTDLAGPFHLYATPAFQDVTHAQKEGTGGAGVNAHHIITWLLRLTSLLRKKKFWCRPKIGTRSFG